MEGAVVNINEKKNDPIVGWRKRPVPNLSGSALNAMTVDVEDYFQVEALSPHIPRSEWDSRECRVERNVERILQLGTNDRPMSVRLDTKRHRLYASTGRGGKIVVLDVSGAPKQVGEVKVGTRPWGFALSADGKYLYTANGPSNDVSVVDTATLKVIKTIPVGSSPWGVAVTR